MIRGRRINPHFLDADACCGIDGALESSQVLPSLECRTRITKQTLPVRAYEYEFWEGIEGWPQPDWLAAHRAKRGVTGIA
jgi:hypothetical protein